MHSSSFASIKSVFSVLELTTKLSSLTIELFGDKKLSYVSKMTTLLISWSFAMLQKVRTLWLLVGDISADLTNGFLSMLGLAIGLPSSAFGCSSNLNLTDIVVFRQFV